MSEFGKKKQILSFNKLNIRMLANQLAEHM